MRVFVTGATGYIGSAVVSCLVRAGHEVVGLVRRADQEPALRASGAVAVPGDLKSPASWTRVAAECHAAVHAAFDRTDGPAADARAVEALLDAMRDGRSQRTFVYTSGVWVLGDTGIEPADESRPVSPAALVAWRPAQERRVLEAGGTKLASAVIRAGIVFGGRGGMVQDFFDTARRDGAAVYPGDGANRWSLVHRDDLAELCRRALERRSRGVFHGVDGHPVPVAQIARACSEAAGRGGAVRSVPLAEARQKLGAYADALALDQAVVSSRAPEVGWRPLRPAFPQAAALALAEREAPPAPVGDVARQPGLA